MIEASQSQSHQVSSEKGLLLMELAGKCLKLPILSKDFSTSAQNILRENYNTDYIDIIDLKEIFKQENQLEGSPSPQLLNLITLFQALPVANRGLGSTVSRRYDEVKNTRMPCLIPV